MRKNTHVANGVSHFDVAGSNLPKLSEFYGAVFGWQILNQGPGYSLVNSPEGSINGALIESGQSALTIGVTVPNLHKAMDAAVASGGSVVMPATDNGWVTKGQVRDPAGNLLSLIQA